MPTKAEGVPSTPSSLMSCPGLCCYKLFLFTSAIAINLKACNHFKLYNGKAAEVCTNKVVIVSYVRRFKLCNVYH